MSTDSGEIKLASKAEDSISGGLVYSMRVCLISKPGTQISTDSCVGENSNRSIPGRYLILGSGR